MCLEGLACLNEGTESASTAQQYTLRKEPDAGNLLRCRYHRFYRKKNHTMAPKKKVSALLKLQIQAGKANPAPPLGPALGSHGVNIMDFCKQYNAATQDKMGQVIPVEITVFEDRSFTFILKTPPAAALLKKAAGIQKGTENPLTHKVGSVTKAQVREIAEIKMADLSARDVEAGMKTSRAPPARWVSRLPTERRGTNGKAFQEVSRSG